MLSESWRSNNHIHISGQEGKSKVLNGISSNFRRYNYSWHATQAFAFFTSLSSSLSQLHVSTRVLWSIWGWKSQGNNRETDLKEAYTSMISWIACIFCEKKKRYLMKPLQLVWSIDVFSTTDSVTEPKAIITDAPLQCHKEDWNILMRH